jgi:hypothetical protein
MINIVSRNLCVIVLLYTVLVSVYCVCVCFKSPLLSHFHGWLMRAKSSLIRQEPPIDFVFADILVSRDIPES